MDLSHLNTFKIYKLRFVCRTISLLEEGPFWGSALHGILGNALRKRLCVTGKPTCENCPEEDACNYIRIFNPVAPSGHQDAKKYADLPQPFIIQKHVFDKVLYMPGDQFTFDFIIVGNAIVDFLHFVNAFVDAGQTGIGRLRGKFEVLQIEHDTIGNGEFEPIANGHKPKHVEIARILKPGSPVSNAGLWFVSPLHLKDKGRYTTRPGPGLILQRIYDRVILLNHFCCEGNLISTDDIVAPNIQTSYNIEKYPFGRFSNRHGKHLKLNGILGKIALQGDLAPIVPLLVLGQWAGIGKMASMGLGMYKIV